MALVYRHIRLDTGKPFYYGIGKTEKRAYSTKSRNPIWKNIVAKTEYKVEILFRDLTWEEACEKEIEFIKLYGRTDLGTGILCNMTDGGDGSSGKIASDYTKKKMSNSRKGQKNPMFGKKMSEEQKKKISNSKKGKRGYWFSKNMSEETKEKIRNKMKAENHHMFGKKMSDETRKKISESSKGKKLSDTTIKKLSTSKIKIPRPRYSLRKQSHQPWIVNFTRESKRIDLGRFYTEQEAQEAIDKWLLENKT